MINCWLTSTWSNTDDVSSSFTDWLDDSAAAAAADDDTTDDAAAAAADDDDDSITSWELSMVAWEQLVSWELSMAGDEQLSDMTGLTSWQRELRRCNTHHNTTQHISHSPNLQWFNTETFAGCSAQTCLTLFVCYYDYDYNYDYDYY